MAATQGRLGAERYFYRYELPKIGAWLKVVESCDPTCAELAEEAAPPSRDYSSSLGRGQHIPAAFEERPASHSDTGEESQQDLDTPAFMRRLKF